MIKLRIKCFVNINLKRLRSQSPLDYKDQNVIQQKLQ